VVPNWEVTPAPVAVVVVPLVVTLAPSDDEPDEDEEPPDADVEVDVDKEMAGSSGLNMSTPVVPTMVATSTMGARLMGFSKGGRTVRRDRQDGAGQNEGWNEG